MASIPQVSTVDSTLGLLKDGFTFIHKRCKEFRSDIFEMNLLLKKVVCISGEEAAKVFYDRNLFQREGAVPKLVQKTLMGEKGVQTMDGEEHKHRKALFMSLMSPERLNDLKELVSQFWNVYIKKWESMKSIALLEESRDLMCEVACAWAGVPLERKEVRKRAADFGAMVDSFGAVDLRHFKGRHARNRTESWIEGMIQGVRDDKIIVPSYTAAYKFAWHRGLDGSLLSTRVAAVELINVVRPIVAINTYITFAALALHENPQYREQLKHGGSDYAEWFIQEVRRYYPFGPFLGAIVKKDFHWRGYPFKKGMLVLLDIYGTNHSPMAWENPDEFRPERFADWNGSAYNFIAQGGGDHNGGHRCAGEWITIEAAKISLHFLTSRIHYRVPEQDLSFDLSRMPTWPKSKFIMTEVQSM